MLKRCGYEEIRSFFDRVISIIEKEQGIKLGIFNKEINNLLTDLISDYSVLKQEIDEFLSKYSYDYLNHIQKYNEKLTMNMNFSYDQTILLTIPDYATIRHFSEFQKYIQEILTDHQYQNKKEDLIFYRDKLKNIYSFFYQIKDQNEQVNKTDKIDLISKSIHYSSEEENINKETSVDFFQNEVELKNYYEYLKSIFVDIDSETKEEKFGMLSQYEMIKKIEKSLTNNVNNTLSNTFYLNPRMEEDSAKKYNLIEIKLKFTIKLFIYIITGIQIYTFFKSLIEANRMYDSMDNNKEKESKFNNGEINEKDFVGYSENQSSIEDLILNLFTINSYENINNLLSSEDKDIENLVSKAKNVKENFENMEDNPEGEAEPENKKVSIFKKVSEKVAQIPIMTKTFSNKVRMFLNNRKSKWIYSRTLGKLDGLFEQYGGDAQIKENNFKDDPVVILKDQLCPDIIRIGKEVAILCDNVEELMKKASNMNSPEAIISLANEWVKGSKIPDLSLAGEKTENLSLSKKIIYGTRSRLVNIICKNNNKIYGFSFQSMVVKKLPPPNIFVISYFLLNFQEVPQPQRVTDIFKSADSFRIMANAEKGDVFQISELMNAVIKNKLTAETFDRIEARRKEINSKMKDAFKSNGEIEIEDEKKKEFKEALKGFEESLKVMFKQKLYVAEIINVFANMIMRIDKLCTDSLKSMLAVEASKVDPRFQKQLGNTVLYKTQRTQDIAEGNKFVN